MNKLPVCLSISTILLTSMAVAGHHAQQPKPHCVDASVYQPINQLLLGNSFVKYLPRHYAHNGKHNLWMAAYGQLSGQYNTRYALVPGSDAITALPELAVSGRNFTASLNNIAAYFGFQHNTTNFVTGVGFKDIATYSNGMTSGGYSLDPSFDLLESYLTYAINPHWGIKVGYFNPSFGTYDATSPMLQMPNFINQTVIGNSDTYATPGVEVAFTHSRFYASLSSVQQGSATQVTGQASHTANLDTFIIDAGYAMPLKGGQFGVGASYINKGAQDDSLQTNSPWRAAWTANAHYTNAKLNVVGTVYNARIQPHAGWVYSLKADYAVKPKIVLGAYGDYLNDPKDGDISVSQLIEPVHWLAGLHGQYRFSHKINLDAYLQYAKADNFASIYGVNKNISAVAAITMKM